MIRGEDKAVFFVPEARDNNSSAPFAIGETRLAVGAWRRRTGQALQSQVTPPLFINAAKQGFLLKHESPARVLNAGVEIK